MKTIVVGVDGSAPSLAALRYALGEARLHGDAVRAVAAWHVPSAAYGAGLAPGVPEPRDFETVAREALAGALEATEAEAAGVPVQTVVREGDAAHVLIEESAGADQLVVGCRDLGLVGRLLHGSVSGRCSHGARCPVTVVHDG